MLDLDTQPKFITSVPKVCGMYYIWLRGKFAKFKELQFTL